MTENTPEGQVQETPKSMSDMLSDEFDRMAETVEEEIESPVEASEEAPEVTEQEERFEERAEEGEERQEEVAEEEPVYDEPAPERWPAEMKEQYNRLPPEAKKMMMEGVFKPMQRQYTKTTMELSQKRKEIEPMLQALQQHQKDFEKAGADPAQVFQNTMAWAAHIQRVGPEQGIEDMRKQFGLADESGKQKEERYLTPTERELKEKLDRLESQQTETLQQQQQRELQARQAAFQQYQQQVRQDLHDFVNETNDGKPAHPHLEQVAPKMRGIIEGGLVQRVDDAGRPIPFGQQLREAYKVAVEMDPNLRSATTTDRQVRRAKAASDIGVVAKQSSRAEEPSPRGLADDLSRQYDRLAGIKR